MRDIGKNIRTLRMQKKMTQDDLAEKLFVTRQTVSNYETGRSRPDVEMVLRIAEVLEVDANAVLYGPPPSHSRKTEVRSMIVCVVLLTVCGILSAKLHYVSVELSRVYNLYLLQWMLELLADPLIMLLLGWTLMQGIELLFNIRPLQQKWVGYARCGIYGLLVLDFLLVAPYLIFQGWVYIRQINAGSVTAHFPHIPIYHQLSKLVIGISIKATYIYALLGFALRIVGFPKGKKAVASE